MRSFNRRKVARGHREALRRGEYVPPAYFATRHEEREQKRWARSYRNPSGKTWLVLGLVGAAAYWAWQQSQSAGSFAGGPMQPQTPVVNPNAAQTGGGSYQPITLSTGGYQVR